MSRKGPMGHGHMKGPGEKAKDFKGSMIRLIKNLRYTLIFCVCYE